MRSPYEVLGVSTSATDEEIRQARRRLLFDLHSDRLPKDLPDGAASLINERVVEINNAYEQIQRERSERGATLISADTKSNDLQKKTTSVEKTAPASKHTEVEDGDIESSTGNAKSKTRVNSIADVLGKVIGALIGIMLVRACRQAQVYEPRENTPEGIETIMNSTTDYCPELTTSFEQQNFKGKDSLVKILSEMKRSAPLGSKYRNRVEALAEQIKTVEGEPTKTIDKEIKEVLSTYLPLICEGQVHLAKEKVKGRVSDIEPSETSQKAQSVFANSMCAAMRDGASMETVDETRATAAIYGGKEMDKLPEGERKLLMMEIMQNESNRTWMEQSKIAIVKTCPDVAHKFFE